ncbi:Hypothetical protein LUCI_0794 [Lucifera butyrica]|uniref:Uncharacterized protein n=1 Tax=Lucifera butyrica TaxID=1351585 RepID=A0A498R289_9FIRM|nr:hypothetical protein [Lucifera butyrica]VBB05584.1 Hypothetical protein LUCI_0794 [Lucifera butyrica]
MSTKADFFVGTGRDAKYLGSIRWDGYPEGIDPKILRSRTQKGFEKNVKKFLANREDGTLTNQGESWTWEESIQIIDYAYCFVNNQVMASYFGDTLFNPVKEAAC